MQTGMAVAHQAEVELPCRPQPTHSGPDQHVRDMLVYTAVMAALLTKVGVHLWDHERTTKSKSGAPIGWGAAATASCMAPTFQAHGGAWERPA